MINHNDASVNIGGGSKNSKIRGGSIRHRGGKGFTENDVSVNIESHAIDSEVTGGSISESENLAEAANEIQQLLNQLAKTYPTTTDAVAVEEIKQEIKRNPTLKQRLQSALKAGGIEALKAIFNHPAVSIPVETIKGLLEAG